MRKYLWLLLVLFVPSTCFCAISSISGVCVNGESITISGTSFGSGSTIISWDNFESHAEGTDLSGGSLSPIVGPNWTTQKLAPATDPVEIDDVRAHSGGQSVYINWDDESINAFGWTGQGPYDSIYISWWGYQSYSGDITDCNRKWFYLFGNNDSIASDMPQGMPLIPAGTSTWGFYNNVSEPAQPNYSGTNCLSSDTTYGTGNTVVFSNTNNTWNRWEYYLTLNTSHTCTVSIDCDAVVKYWIDSVLIFYRDDYRMRHVDGEWVDFRLGHMWQESGGTPDGAASVWIDDVFIATNQSRVEIGDNVTFANCTHREVQYHTAWSTTEIIATVNVGSFADNDTAYVFVIDSDGTASSGYEITIGSGPNNASIGSGATCKLGSGATVQIQ